MQQDEFSKANYENTPGSSVPSSPSEVSVRTMASDIASISESGGWLAKARPVKVSFRSARGEEENAPGGVVPQSPRKQTEFANTPPRKSLFSEPAFLYIFFLILIIVVFFAGYYLVFPLLN